jgi:murein DD-endopeptidase MepM/ murein hydrolase activator NlpD
MVKDTIAFITQLFRSWWHLAMLLLIIIFCIMVGVLVSEYRYFQREAEKMVALQTEYKNHIMATKRLLQGSSLVGNQNKDESASSDEKKNDETDDDSFLLVNRGLENAKDVTVAHYKKIRVPELYARVPGYEWLEYTDWVLNENEKEQKRIEQRREARKKRAADRAAKRALARAQRRRMRNSMIAQKIFSWPVEPSHFWVSSIFGPRKRPNGAWGFHYGLDMAAVRGTPVYAAAAGTVIETNFDRGYGKNILIMHDSQYQTRYAHLDAILVKEGQLVQRGQRIGKVGKTGAVRGRFDGSHLHFEVHSCGKRVNPVLYLH